MTAELAVALPAVLLVLAGCLGALRLGVEQARLEAAAALASRSAARGDPPAAAEAHGTGAGAASVQLEHRAGLVCARAVGSWRILGAPVPITAVSCALEP